MDKSLKEYCCGCKLCSVTNKAVLGEDDKGFYYPISGDVAFLKKVCPSYGTQVDDMDISNIWGRYVSVYYGWSNNSEVRHNASSGGVLTEIACFLLSTQRVDAIIQTTVNPKCPTETITVINSTVDEVKDCCGSRYAISHPLDCLLELDLSKKYAFIGKPCDVVALKNYIKLVPEIGNSIIITLSFFCAGMPSKKAQDNLLANLKIEKENLRFLRYRGNGWPGEATAVDNSGKIASLDYNTAWSKILGRDIMKVCRYCIDSIGEMADISCGDAWYLTNNKPDFNDRPGRNVIFARTQEGNKILKSLIEQDIIEVSDADMNALKINQACHYDRRSTMSSKIFATKITGRAVPKYPKSALRLYKKHISYKKRVRFGLGTIKRIIQGKI